MKVFGVVRATVAVLAGAGLVWGATQTTDTADATRPADVRQLDVDTTSSALRDVSLSCTGAAAAGRVRAASAPADWVHGTASGGSVSVTTDGRSKPLSLRRGGAVSTDLPATTAASVVGKGGLATGLVATQTQLDERTTARGLNVSGCGGPVQDGWFFGGGHDDGRVARLALVNTGATPTTVDVTVLGADGADAAASVKGTVLAPGERKVLVLGDFAAALAAPAVHVTATGAGVSASLTDAWMNGETPVGEDTTSAPVTPAEKLTVPGVSATSAAPQVRVAVPGKDEAIVRVRVVNTAGAVVVDKVQTVAPGTSTGVTLTGLTTGNYDVQITGDVPVAASVMSRTAGSGTTDLTWAPALPAIDGPAGIAIPDGIPQAKASLMLSAPTATSADVITMTSAGPKARTVAIPADRPVVTDIGAGATAVWVRPGKGHPVHAAVTLRGRHDNADLLATMPLDQTPLSQSTKRLVPARG
ncbi:hypothetical protein GCM10011492_32230 [Flexivirga endophytica]|uniref:Uncharacterized protein n=1 Tax=Flexivirga endophytica TaxID=1849103 RepID=A0A916WYA0_9MICO|nr:DUF5719 family protein [Flexivirga endophytica]GGB39011.1 hypothetical protein GCM10011492_32230 [Flexivirga endophytica]GHB46976.1 hypothetical protein GCM10008112_14620 [Flexivirga endophytica]